MTRLLTIMGSGETAPTMVKAHRAVVERLGPPPVRGVLLDTPFGFQMNAGELAERAVVYFRESVGAELEVAGLRSAADLAGPHRDEVLAALSRAGFVFAGPGSPTYALRQWGDTLVPGLIAEKLSHGGAVTFASAAALTLGAVTVPVYEIYKVGEEPRWETGLDLLGPLGLHVAVIPHYDNAEGGTHDTRFCYLGEERLALLERSLPEDTFVLGVDEHTALFLDFEADRAWVTGRGGVTVRVQGRSTRIEADEELPVTGLVEMAAGLLSGRAAPATAQVATGEPGRGTAAAAEAAVPGASPLLESIRAHEERFRVATAAKDAVEMRATALSLEEELWAWRADTLQSDEADRGRAALRAMIGELGVLAEVGAVDRAEVIGPFLEVTLMLRDAARRDRRFADADAARTRLEELGVEVRDAGEGSTWELRGRPGDDG